MQLCRNNPHPARGRKPSNAYLTHLSARNNPHPARGRKLAIGRSTTSTSGNNPHPARGRKLFQSDVDFHGVGNNPHPARGRKPSSATTPKSVVATKQPTPRKGTETGGTPCSASSPARNDPHPARGRKLSCRPYPHFLSGNDPHPARGRKPRAIRISSISEETTHTPQGDGNLHPVGKPINHSKQPTPRKGTET